MAVMWQLRGIQGIYLSHQQDLDRSAFVCLRDETMVVKVWNPYFMSYLGFAGLFLVVTITCSYPLRSCTRAVKNGHSVIMKISLIKVSLSKSDIV